MFVVEGISREIKLEPQGEILVGKLAASSGGTGSAPAADDSPMRVALADLLQQVGDLLFGGIVRRESTHAVCHVRH